jgi:nitrogenase molybdenum-iron protein alpha/beta subunit
MKLSKQHQEKIDPHFIQDYQANFMSLNMKIVENNSFFDDKMQPGAFIGATLIASGIKHSAIIYHGYLGCNIESIHMRSDSIPGGFYTPIIATGLNENDSIYGGYDKLKRTLIEVARKNFKIIWILTGDATSITGDDIYNVSKDADLSKDINVIPLDVPGFLGGIVKGTDISITRLLETLKPVEKQKDSVCLLAPHLMGIKSHPVDIFEIKELLCRANIPVHNILSKNLDAHTLQTLRENKYFYPLTWESLSCTKHFCAQNNITLLNNDSLLPIGIANTESWLIEFAKTFNKETSAQKVLLEDKNIVTSQLKYNYNFSWLSTLYTEKTCSIYGNCQFAVSLATCFFYDLNIKPRVIAILAETEEAIITAKKHLEELSKFTEITVLVNPDYYTYINHVKAASVDFAVGSIQDKPLCTGENIPHMSLAGYYFFNNYNFIPWPYMGVKGILTLLTELGFLMEKTFYYEEYWKNYTYKPQACD